MFKFLSRWFGTSRVVGVYAPKNSSRDNRIRFRDSGPVFDENIASVIPSQMGAPGQAVIAVIRESVTTGVTAHAGGGQQVNSPVSAQATEVTTVASAGDSVTLPVETAYIGVTLSVTNAAAVNSMNVFPNTGAKINGGGANAAYALAAGKTAYFTCVKAGQWYAVSGS